MTDRHIQLLRIGVLSSNEEAITENELRSGRPKDATTNLQVDLVHCLVINDRGVTIQHIANTVEVSFGSYSSLCPSYERTFGKISSKNVNTRPKLD